jgi:predicted aspartyl protease
MATRLLLFLLVLLSVREVRAADPPATKPVTPSDDAVRTALLMKGYVAVPLVPGTNGDPRYSVVCSFGQEKFPLLLDTGAGGTVLDPTLVKKLGLTEGEEINVNTLGGDAKGRLTEVRGLKIGDLDTRRLFRSVVAFSMPVHEAKEDYRGVLGQNLLRLLSAVIDCSTHTLYLLPPLRRLWPAVEGKWVATGGEEDGKPRAIDTKRSPVVEFKDDCLRFTDGDTKYEWGIQAGPRGDGYGLVLYDPTKELDDGDPFTAGALLKVTGDKLVMCLVLKGKAKFVPTEFAAPKGSGLVLLEFERAK